MKTKNEIIEELYHTNFIESYVRVLNSGRYTEDELEDIVQDIYVMICDLSEEKLQRFYSQGGINKVRQYCSGLISRQICSEHSSTFYQYRKRQPWMLVDDMEQLEKNLPDGKL